MSFRRPYIQLVTPLMYLKQSEITSMEFGKIPCYYKFGGIMGNDLISEGSNFKLKSSSGETVLQSEGILFIDKNGTYTFSFELNGEISNRVLKVESITNGSNAELPFFIGFKDHPIFSTDSSDSNKFLNIGEGNMHEASFAIMKNESGFNNVIEMDYYETFASNPKKIVFEDQSYTNIVDGEGNILYNDKKFFKTNRVRNEGFYILKIKFGTSDKNILKKSFYVVKGVVTTDYNSNFTTQVDYIDSNIVSALYTISDPIENNDENNYEIENVSYYILTDPSEDLRPGNNSNVNYGIINPYIYISTKTDSPSLIKIDPYTMKSIMLKEFNNNQSIIKSVTDSFNNKYTLMNEGNKAKVLYLNDNNIIEINENCKDITVYNNKVVVVTNSNKLLKIENGSQNVITTLNCNNVLLINDKIFVTYNNSIKVLNYSNGSIIKELTVNGNITKLTNTSRRIFVSHNSHSITSIKIESLSVDRTIDFGEEIINMESDENGYLFVVSANKLTQLYESSLDTFNTKAVKGIQGVSSDNSSYVYTSINTAKGSRVDKFTRNDLSLMTGESFEYNYPIKEIDVMGQDVTEVEPLSKFLIGVKHVNSQTFIDRFAIEGDKLVKVSEDLLLDTNTNSVINSNLETITIASESSNCKIVDYKVSTKLMELRSAAYSTNSVGRFVCFGQIDSNGPYKFLLLDSGKIVKFDNELNKLSENVINIQGKNLGRIIDGQFSDTTGTLVLVYESGNGILLVTVNPKDMTVMKNAYIENCTVKNKGVQDNSGKYIISFNNRIRKYEIPNLTLLNEFTLDGNTSGVPGVDYRDFILVSNSNNKISILSPTFQKVKDVLIEGKNVVEISNVDDNFFILCQNNSNVFELLYMNSDFTITGNLLLAEEESYTDLLVGVSYSTNRFKNSIYSTIADKGDLLSNLDSSFVVDLYKDLTYRLQFDSVKRDYVTGAELWRKTNTVYGDVFWIDKTQEIPAPNIISPVNGMSGYTETQVIVEKISGYEDEIRYISRVNGTITNLTGEKTDSYFPYMNVYEYSPSVQGGGVFDIEIKRTKVGTNISKTFIITIETETIIDLDFRFTNITDNELKIDKFTPELQILPNSIDPNEVSVNMNYKRLYNGQNYQSEMIPFIQGVNRLAPTEINASGDYEIYTQISISDKAARDGVTVASGTIRFSVDIDPPPIPIIKGINESEVAYSFNWLVEKIEGCNFEIVMTENNTGRKISPKYSIRERDGITYYGGTILDVGNWSIQAKYTKTRNNKVSTYDVKYFEIVSRPESDRLINITPSMSSYDKNVNIKYSGGLDKLINLHEYKINNIDYSWDPNTQNIKHSNEFLEYYTDFMVIDPSIKGFNSITANDYNMKPDKELIYSESSQFTTLSHEVPPQPIVKIEYLENGRVKLTIINMDTKFKYIIRLDGSILNTNSNTIYCDKEGKHKLHVIVINKNNFKKNEDTVDFIVYKKYPLVAPAIAVKPTVKVVKGTDINVELLYHPYSEKKYYQVSDGNKIELDGNRFKFKVNDNCVIHASCLNTNPITNLLDYDSEAFRVSKCCLNANPLECDKSWKGIYDEYLQKNRHWNIENNYYDKLLNKNVGIEYRTINNIVPKEEDIIIPPEIVGIDNVDGIQYSCYPHVKRNFNQQYFAFLDNTPFELGNSVSETELNLVEKHRLRVGTEYRKQGVIKRSKDIDTKDILIDTEFPPFPKLIEDVESVMTEPFQIDVVREKGIIYYSKLWRILPNKDNNYEPGNTHDENYKPFIKEEITDFNLGDFIFEDGEYILEISAYKISNKTSRNKTFYFTINTFQDVELKPLKTKILPLELMNSEKSYDGELLIDKNSGHYGIKDGDNIHMPTVDLDKKIIGLEEIILEVSKTYNDSLDHIEDIFKRYEANRNTIEDFLKDCDVILEVFETLNKEFYQLKKDTDTFTNRLDNDINRLNSNRKAEIIIQRATNLLTGMDIDRKSMFKILRLLHLITFHSLRKARRLQADFKDKMLPKMTKEQFQVWKNEQERKFSEFENKVAEAYNKSNKN